MRTLVHLSDLHFGAILSATLDPLVAELHALAPDLVIVSGDLTQRARPEQFADARAFLDRLPTPQLLLPGNHDVPLYDLFRRFAKPLERYRDTITTDLAPAFIDDEVAVVGINTARSLTFKGGRINEDQARDAAAIFHALDGPQARIVVTHHPLHVPPHLSGVDPVGRAAMALELLAPCRVDLYLAGHLHLVHEAATHDVPHAPEHADTPLLVAGTATSTRARGEPNSYFVIRTGHAELDVETRVWNAARACFERGGTRQYSRNSA
jgi:3',5'-cyclic AMP phosphodiesterase CpdA